MKFNKFYFENYSIDTPFDENNPRFVLAEEGADVILEKIINAQPYSIDKTNFENRELVQQLCHVDVLQIREGKLGMAVPFFVKRDAEILKKLSRRTAQNIADRLLENKEKIISIIQKVGNGYSYDRNLYHLLGGYIFDGLIFDFLEQEQLVTTSCQHSSGLDYLVILYEDTEELNKYSDKLLCSYNRLIVNGKGFVSFGDSNGNRKDFYRYMRLKELGKLTEQELKYVSFEAAELVENFEKLVEKQTVKSEYIKTYEYFGYYKNGQVTVPVYSQNDYSVAEELYENVLQIIKNEIKEALIEIENCTELTVMAHKVCVRDIANEIYHLIFGEVNELLVQNLMFAMPDEVVEEGRYLKSFER